MSQQEFETYLSVLSRLLRLNPAQRDQVAEELRDHLETRLEELTSQGVPHAEAVKRALDEFGDVAGVANSFSSLTAERRRRLAMRVTTVSIGVLAGLVLVAVAFWPGAQGPAARPALAQVPGVPGTPGSGALAHPAPELEKGLAKRISVEFNETPLKDVVAYLSDVTEVQFYLDVTKMAEVGTPPDTAVTINLKQVKLETILGLLLEPLALAYYDRDGLLIITTEEARESQVEARVYNCRDLLVMELPGARRRETGLHGNPAATPGTGTMSSQPQGGNPMGGSLPGAGGGMPSGGFGGGLGGMVPRPQGPSGFGQEHDERARRLLDLIQHTVSPHSWDDAGGPGTISEYGGLVVVRHNFQVQRDVEKLLTMLREQAAAPASESRPGSAKNSAQALPGTPGTGFPAGAIPSGAYPGTPTPGATIPGTSGAPGR